LKDCHQPILINHLFFTLCVYDYYILQSAPEIQLSLVYPSLLILTMHVPNQYTQ
jgi:hypothetical protein